MAKRRFLPNQKTVYDLKLLVIFLKKSVMFFKKSVMFLKKSVMFYQSLADLCYSPVYSLIIYKPALDKIQRNECESQTISLLFRQFISDVEIIEVNETAYFFGSVIE